MNSPVLEYSPRGGWISAEPPDQFSFGRSRLFCETGTFEHGRWVSYGDFVDWAQSINDWIRRTWHRDKSEGCYLGPGAAREIARIGAGQARGVIG
jgi:hypothetical protein